jgi:hypothetical protein
LRPGETVDVKAAAGSAAPSRLRIPDRGQLRVGAEVDFSFADPGSAADPFFEGKSLDARIRWLATATG